MVGIFGNLGPKSKRILAVAGVFAAFAIAGGVGVLVAHTKKEKSPDTQIVGTLEENLAPVIKEAQRSSLRGETKEAIALLQNELTKPKLTNEQKQALYIELGNTYSVAGDNKTAVVQYKEAEKYKSDYNLSALIGDTSLVLGDKVTAKAYYQKALTQLDKKYVLYESEKMRTEQKIKDLGI